MIQMHSTYQPSNCQGRENFFLLPLKHKPYFLLLIMYYLLKTSKVWWLSWKSHSPIQISFSFSASFCFRWCFCDIFKRM